MSDLINIENELVRLASALDLLTIEYEGLCRRAADARTDYDLAFAKALLSFKTSDKGVTVAIAQAMATETCAVPMREARIAESIRDAAKERIRALEAQLTVHQSRLRWLDEGRRIG